MKTLKLLKNSFTLIPRIYKHLVILYLVREGCNVHIINMINILLSPLCSPPM